MKKAYGSEDLGSLHLTLGVDDHAGVVFEVDHNAIGTAPLLTLTDDAGEMDFLTELGLTFLDSCEDEITGGGLGEAVQAGSPSLDGHDVKVLGCFFRQKTNENYDLDSKILILMLFQKNVARQF